MMIPSFFHTIRLTHTVIMLSKNCKEFTINLCQNVNKNVVSFASDVPNLEARQIIFIDTHSKFSIFALRPAYKEFRWYIMQW